VVVLPWLSVVVASLFFVLGVPQISRWQPPQTHPSLPPVLPTLYTLPLPTRSRYCQPGTWLRVTVTLLRQATRRVVSCGVVVTAYTSNDRHSLPFSNYLWFLRVAPPHFRVSSPVLACGLTVRVIRVCESRRRPLCWGKYITEFDSATQPYHFR
jgi:hypothetical protein